MGAILAPDLQGGFWLRDSRLGDYNGGSCESRPFEGAVRNEPIDEEYEANRKENEPSNERYPAQEEHNKESRND